MNLGPDGSCCQLADLCAGTDVTSDLGGINEWTGISGENYVAGAKIIY